MLETIVARYEANLHALTRYGQKLRQEGYKHTAYGRVLELAERLKAHYQLYLRTKNVAPMQAEIDRFLADPWELNAQEDGRLPARLHQLLAELRQGYAGLTLTVSAAAPTEAPVVSDAYLKAPAARETVAN